MKHRKPRLTQRLYDALVVEWMIGWHQGHKERRQRDAHRHSVAERKWRARRPRQPWPIRPGDTFVGPFVRVSHGQSTATGSTLTVRLQADLEAFSRSMARANGSADYLAHRISWQSIKARERAKARADWDEQRREMWARYGLRPPIVAGGVVVARAREIQR